LVSGTGSGLDSQEPQLARKAQCAQVVGFSLHAAQWVAAHERRDLEALLRYALRPPFAGGRLSLSPDGRVLYQLRRPWPKPGGASQLILDPLDFLRRLAALLPRPYAHAARYHGCFAGRSAARKLLPKPPLPSSPAIEASAVEGTNAEGGDAAEAESSVSRRVYRHPWHQLLRRVFQAEGLACPRCSRPGKTVAMVVLAFLSDPPVVEKILRHLKLPTTPPVIAPARSSVTSPGLFPCTAQNPPGNAGAFVLPDSPGLSEPEDGGAIREEEEETPPPIRPPP
jgi:hypothetical protein